LPKEYFRDDLCCAARLQTRQEPQIERILLMLEERLCFRVLSERRARGHASAIKCHLQTTPQTPPTSTCGAPS
ncbi:hypothetical protein KCU59_g27, partial [Aureobasidium melanogenum]